MTVPMPFEIPLALHLYRDGREKHCTKLKLTAEECEWYSNWWHNWYTADWAYALPVVYFVCAMIGVLSIRHWAHVIGTRHKESNLRRRLSALTSSLLNRSTFVAGWSTPNLGVALIIGAGMLFSLVLVVAHQPYYWPDGLKFGTTPPVAIRAGWMSLAMLPFLIIFASKVNPLTILTGMSYEHLNVFHRWTAWAMYIATLVHTFGFVVQNSNNHAWTSRVQSTNQYWTGFVALVPQTALMVLSIRPVRSRGFEIFKKLHYFMSLFYVVMLFVHCEFILSSVDYFIALGSIYFFLLAIRWARALGRNGFKQAEVQVIDEAFLRLSVPSGGLKWSASQHYLVRFYAGGLSGFSSHPFTVSSTPDSSEIEFIIRRRTGITNRLAKQVHASGGSRAFKVLLDGPYGGLPNHFSDFEHVIIVAGGSGASFALGALRSLSANPRRVRRISFLFASHSPALLRLVSMAAASLPVRDDILVSCELYDTSATRELSCDDSSEKASLSKKTCIDWKVGRPDLAACVQSSIRLDDATSVAVAVCGPARFSHAVTTAVAESQRQVARGELHCSIELHSEAFDS